LYAYMCVCMYARVYGCVEGVCVCLYAYMYIYVCMCVYMYVCVCMCVYGMNGGVRDGELC